MLCSTVQCVFVCRYYGIYFVHIVVIVPECDVLEFIVYPLFRIAVLVVICFACKRIRSLIDW